MNFLWILIGLLPGTFLYLIYLSQKHYYKDIKIFKDFWACFISWTLAGTASCIYSFFTKDILDSLPLFICIGCISNILGVFYVMSRDKNKNKKQNKSKNKNKKNKKK